MPDFVPHRTPTPRQATTERIPVGPLPLVTAAKQLDPIIRRLALDRLRDLRDDGVTTDYIGRMYGVGPERILQIERELRIGGMAPQRAGSS